MTPHPAPQPRAQVPALTVWHRAACSRRTVLAALWAAAVLISLLAPGLVPGTGDRPVPLAAMTAWVWAAAATGFLMLLPPPRLPYETVATGYAAMSAVLHSRRVSAW